MARRYIKIEVDCCGDCPYYSYRHHECSKGAVDTEKTGPASPFYDDCPLEWEEIKHEEE